MTLFKTLTLGFSFLILSTTSLFAQSEQPKQAKKSKQSDNILIRVQEKEEGKGEVTIFQDMRINNLLYNHRQQNKRKSGTPGYRISIYSNLGNTAREESQDIKAKFYDLFPLISVYAEYDSPYFKVYVGDYRTKIDALKDFKKIKRHFKSAFIVPDKINYPKLEE